MKVKYTKKFVKQYDKADLTIQTLFKEKLNLFINDPSNPQLRNHPLKGPLIGYRTINITGDWRALYTEKQQEEETIITFEMIGTHSQLYK
jgi:addiction module RelE/StbE family toxin